MSDLTQLNQYRGRSFRIAALLYDGALALDFVGPLEAFNYATCELSQNAGDAIPNGYEIDFIGARAGPIQTSIGAQIYCNQVFADYERSIDILIIPGQIKGDTRYRSPKLFAWLKEQEQKIPRIASICSGAYVLAEAGLLSGKRVTTHWMHSDPLRRAHPDIRVEADKIFCRDGSILSSGGVTAGIDLALSIIEEDFGRSLALKVAKRMVVFLQRNGDQAQFSDVLFAQSLAGRFSAVIDWIESNLGKEISIELLAEQCSMSPRNFSRQFRDDIGEPPMAYVSLRRFDYAKRLLEETRLPIASIASSCGFKSTILLRRAFLKAYGVTPAEYRERFGLPNSAQKRQHS